jgi:hypothetical protein
MMKMLLVDRICFLCQWDHHDYFMELALLWFRGQINDSNDNDLWVLYREYTNNVGGLESS